MVEQQISSTFTCNMGVRPRENLSPSLFAFHVNDLQEAFIQLNCNVLNFSYDLVNAYLELLVLMYADNTVILFDSEENMK